MPHDLCQFVTNDHGHIYGSHDRSTHRLTHVSLDEEIHNILRYTYYSKLSTAISSWYLPQNGSSSLVSRYIFPRPGDLSEWYPMLPHLDLSLHGKHSPSRNFSYDSHGTAGNAQLGDTLSVKNLYALRWLHRLLPYTSGAAEIERMSYHYKYGRNNETLCYV